MTRRALALGLVAWATQVGCSGEADPLDPSREAPTLDVVPGEYSLETRDLRALADGDDLTLQLPPQGGRVAFVGARVKGATADRVRLTVRLATAEGTELVLDGRTVPLDPAGAGEDVRKTSIESFTAQANLRLCPDWEGRRVDDRPFDVRVEVEEVGGRGGRGTAQVRVVARCSPGDDGCGCLCAADYQQGSCF